MNQLLRMRRKSIYKFSHLNSNQLTCLLHSVNMYQCTRCSKSYVWSGDLLRHAKTKHSQQAIPQIVSSRNSTKAKITQLEQEVYVQKELVEVLQLRCSIKRRLLKESSVSHQQAMCENQELKQELRIQKELQQELHLQVELSEGKVKELHHALDTQNQELKQELRIQKELHQELHSRVELSEGKVKELHHALDTQKDVSRREEPGEVLYFILFV
jgi:hypothetical protein